MRKSREMIDMKRKSCVAITSILLVLSLINASIVMAQTLKYAPTPQELPEGFYYTSIETGSPQVLDEFQSECGVKPIYSELVEFRKKSVTGGIFISEFSNIEDAKEGYSCCFNNILNILSEGYVTEIDAFGEESISASFIDGSSATSFRNDKFIVWIGTNDLDELNNSKIVVTDILPKIIDEKLEQIKAPTPTPTEPPEQPPTPTPKPPGFEVIFAITCLLAVVTYLLRKKKR